MIDLSLTDFIDVVSKIGPQKATKLSQIKHRPPYQPAFDYYKPLRDHIAALHKSGGSKTSFMQPSQLTADSKKWTNYAELIADYQSFWGRKSFQWFDPAHRPWTSNGVEISINPELGLVINGVPHVVKLYFKSEKLSKQRADTSLFLMHQFLPRQYSGQNIVYSILDIREKNLIPVGAFPANILASLIGESAYIQSVWPTL
jgi:hypothetical protein